jgi:hypothetical protein
MQILAILNKETRVVMDYLKTYFTYVPIYNINYGYISISNRYILEAINKLPKGSMEPYDWECAGETLLMLKYAAGLSLFFIVLIENNILSLGLRPFMKPVFTHLEMIHESTQRKKLKKAYNIKKASTLEDVDF